MRRSSSAALGATSNPLLRGNGVEGGALFEGYADAVAGAQSDGSKWNHGMPGHEAELKFLRDGGQEQRSLHQREGIADALARTSAKWEISETRKALS
jgi:hypothetical protein